MLASRPPTPRCAAHGMTHPYSRSAHWDRGCVWGRGEGADQCMHWGIWPLRVSVSSIRGALDSLVFSSVSAALACGVFGVAGSCWVMMMMIGSIDRASIEWWIQALDGRKHGSTTPTPSRCVAHSKLTTRSIDRSIHPNRPSNLQTSIDTHTRKRSSPPIRSRCSHEPHHHQHQHRS